MYKVAPSQPVIPAIKDELSTALENCSSSLDETILIALQHYVEQFSNLLVVKQKVK